MERFELDQKAKHDHERECQKRPPWAATPVLMIGGARVDELFAPVSLVRVALAPAGVAPMSIFGSSRRTARSRAS